MNVFCDQRFEKFQLFLSKFLKPNKIQENCCERLKLWLDEWMSKLLRLSLLLNYATNAHLNEL